MPPSLRICFFGDSFVNGTGDDACLGWVGRACAASRAGGLDLTCYNLGIRRDSSADLLRRWDGEARARLLPEHDGRLVFSFGANDCSFREGTDQARIPHHEAVANARAILGAAQTWLPTLMVGPLPVSKPAVDADIAALSAAFVPVCAEIGVPYLEVFHLAAQSSDWARDVAAGDGVHPNVAGYSLISEAVQRWPVWRAWNAN